MKEQMANPVLRAIDLYSGVGGWGLGLRMAGIRVVASFDRAIAANNTNAKNNHHKVHEVDIRKLRMNALPKRVDIVVGSPPCTQFSLSNRGGTGNIDDGLRDIRKFLKIVDHLKPRFWAMENVPRVAKILEAELKPKGKLYKFRHLKMTVGVFDMEQFGLPQRRKRCIAGNIDFDLLKTYANTATKRSLGDVVEMIGGDDVCDPLYGLELRSASLHDHVVEDFLDREETRINRAAKIYHPVYNRMAFPDRLTNAVRTLTATCTRVSRESIVIRHPDKTRRLRRLTIRERACLQGFPVTFQFYGQTYSDKIQLVGNAVPPLFSFYVGNAIRGVSASKLSAPAKAIECFRAPQTPPPATPPGAGGRHFRKQRPFRFAIPRLRLKSGVRFELANSFPAGRSKWKIAFVFGNSKSIHGLRLNKRLHVALRTSLRRLLSAEAMRKVIDVLAGLKSYAGKLDTNEMQQVWSRRAKGAHPFDVLDRLDADATSVLKILRLNEKGLPALVERALTAQYGATVEKLAGRAKLSRNAAVITTGLLLGSLVNQELSPPPKRKKSREA